MDLGEFSFKSVGDESLEIRMGNDCWQLILNYVLIRLAGTMGYWNK